jgi:hypothetical protein
MNSRDKATKPSLSSSRLKRLAVTMVVAFGLCLSDTFCSAEIPNVGISSNKTEGIFRPAMNTIGQTPPTPAALPLELPDAPLCSPADSPVFDTIRLMGSRRMDEEPKPSSLGTSTQFLIDPKTLTSIQNLVRVYLTGAVYRSAKPVDGLDEPWRDERHHWRGLIAQSLFFNAVESGFRIANDDQIRYLIVRKPVWHDYFASMRQFNMGRWNDGDNLLTNYVGHPMQGAVSCRARSALSSKCRTTLWDVSRRSVQRMTIGSAGSKVSSGRRSLVPAPRSVLLARLGSATRADGPIRLETVIGPAQYNPKTWKTTNNTGWVDFVITPTLGSVWMVAEDTIDRYVSDRMQGGESKRDPSQDRAGYFESQPYYGQCYAP